MDIELLQGIGRQPVTAEYPAGHDVRSDPRFDALQTELGKLAMPGADNQTDWPQVAQLCANLLVDKGKDLLVGSYLAGALLQTDGLTGLATGLEVLVELVEHHWEKAFPPLARLRGRRNAIQWLIDRVELVAPEQDWPELAPQPAELVGRLRTGVQRLDALLTQHDEDSPPLRPVRQWIERIPVLEPPPPAAQAAPAPVAAATPAIASPANAAVAAPARAAAAQPPAPPAFSAGDDLEAALERALEHLQQLAGLLMQAGSLDPRAFRLSRVANWAALQQLPPADNGQTRLPAPIPQVVQTLQNLQGGAAPEDAVAFAEAQLPAFPLWLDLQWLCASALGQLGAAGAPARAEVERAAADLLARLPGLSALSFSSGLPLAGGDTLRWLESLPAGGGANPAGAAAGPAGTAGPALAQARALAANGELQTALTQLQAAIDAAGDAADRLRLRIGLCELLQQHQEGRVPPAFAQELVEQVQRHDLARWAPQLALAAWAAAYPVLRAAGDEAGAAHALAAVARLDAARALQLVLQAP